MKRSLYRAIQSDLVKKFVFLAGPRQVGKTTLAQSIMKEHKGRYLLYDDPNDRREILERGYVESEWVCLDEFHKYPKWKNHLKGVYDKYHSNLHLLLTGSARLDVYQRSGDSLFGRYYLHHLHPLTVGELSSERMELPSNLLESTSGSSGVEELLKWGGFPEPFLAQDSREHLRWSNARRQLLIREDMRDLTQIELLNLVEDLVLMLPKRIGSMFSAKSLSEDLGVSGPTVQKWMQVLERLYLVFKIRPYSKKINRSIQKQPKYYLYDWSQIEDPARRFENFVASHLYKATQMWTDMGEGNFELNFVRDRDRREVDFLIQKERKPWCLVEVKLSETILHPPLELLSNRFNIPGIQIIQTPNYFKRTNNTAIVSADRWLGWLP